jgi:hypothetical protein
VQNEESTRVYAAPSLYAGVAAAASSTAADDSAMDVEQQQQQQQHSIIVTAAPPFQVSLTTIVYVWCIT